MTAQEVEAFIAEHFAVAKDFSHIDEVGDDWIRCRLPYQDSFLRPGGTISGPTLMAFADTAAYLLILAMLGPVALAVTTNLNMNFLRKPEPATMIGKARMLKLGKSLAVVEVMIESSATGALVAQSTATYSLPPNR
ncbi:MAG: PaaI family thioesterase [Kofleriaceae bacterium]